MSPSQLVSCAEGQSIRPYRLLARKLPGRANCLVLLPRRLFRRLLIESPPLHFPKHSFALHFFLQTRRAWSTLLSRTGICKTYSWLSWLSLRAASADRGFRRALPRSMDIQFPPGAKTRWLFLVRRQRHPSVSHRKAMNRRTPAMRNRWPIARAIPILGKSSAFTGAQRQRQQGLFSTSFWRNFVPPPQRPPARVASHRQSAAMSGPAAQARSQSPSGGKAPASPPPSPSQAKAGSIPSGTNFPPVQTLK